MQIYLRPSVAIKLQYAYTLGMITTYIELIEHFGSPTKAAIGLGLVKDTASAKKKLGQAGRVCNWAKNGLPKRDKKLLKKFALISASVENSAESSPIGQPHGFTFLPCLVQTRLYGWHWIVGHFFEVLMYCAMAKIKGTNQWEVVTLFGDLFFADKGLIEMFIEYSKKKHPDWEYMTRRV